MTTPVKVLASEDSEDDMLVLLNTLKSNGYQRQQLTKCQKLMSPALA